MDPRIENREIVYQGGNELWVNSHIQEIPENGADAAHLMAVHGDTVFSGATCGPRNWLWSVFCGSHGWEGNWRQKPGDDQRHVALSELKHYLRFFKYRIFDVDIVAEQVKRQVFYCIEL